jgi:hypothetical protein
VLGYPYVAQGQDPDPLPSERLSIGGYLSAVTIGPISVVDLDEAQSATP